MRFWALHPYYLDPAGLGAMWREAAGGFNLLANPKIGGNYQKHSQLERFKATKDPCLAFVTWLYLVYEESLGRGYRYKWKEKYTHYYTPKVHEILETDTTEGQILFELKLLVYKMENTRKHRPQGQLGNIMGAIHEVENRPSRAHRYAHPYCRVIPTNDKAYWEKMEIP